MNRFNRILLDQLKDQNELCKKCLPTDDMLCGGMRLRLRNDDGALVSHYEPCRKLREKTYLESFKRRCINSGIPSKIVEVEIDKDYDGRDFLKDTDYLAINYSLAEFKEIQSYVIENIRHNIECLLLMCPVLEEVKPDYNRLLIDPEVLVLVRYDLLKNKDVKDSVVFNLSRRVDLGKKTILVDKVSSLDNDECDIDYLDIRGYFK